MKKNILFIVSNLNIGGFQKSLINLLSEFDYDKYDVYLLMIDQGGVFLNLVPEHVNIINVDFNKDFFKTFKTSALKLIRDNQYLLLLYRLLCAFISLFDKGYGGYFMSKALPKINKEFDVAIDYNGQYLMYYMVDKIKAKKKISYFHSDYSKWNYYKNMDKKYYPKVDYIVTVSDMCSLSLKDYFPTCKEKIKVIENIISDKTVNIFPLNSNTFTDNYLGIRLVTVGRVCEDKGILLALETAELLKKEKLNYKWYFVGPVDDLDKYNQIIKEKDLDNYIVLLGATNNPYDYMRNSDIIVHPSKFEGKAVAVEEAKILHKPIVATNFSTVYDQIENGVTGLIVEMNPQHLSTAILSIINNASLRESIIKNQKVLCNGNSGEAIKLYELIEN